MIAELTAKIEQVKECAVYNGNVYTQDVVAELQNNQTVELFDGDVTCVTDDMVGKQVPLELETAVVTGVSATNETTIGITATNDHYDIAGEVVAKAQRSDRSVTRVRVLDGGVLVNSRETEGFGEGDCVEITSHRIDVLDTVRKHAQTSTTH